jgi:OFA family oxalate/formate antiporter-like MFS transporter
VTALGLALVLDRILNGVTRPFWGWVSDHIGRYKKMSIASAFVFFAWGEIYSLFPAAIGDVFGPDYTTTNYGLLYTAKGIASIFAGWGAALLAESTGSWLPVFWVAVACDLLAAGLAFFWLRPLAARLAEGRVAVSPAIRPVVAGP